MRKWIYIIEYEININLMTDEELCKKMNVEDVLDAVYAVHKHNCGTSPKEIILLEVTDMKNVFNQSLCTKNYPCKLADECRSYYDRFGKTSLEKLFE